jgi:hypothetical protein
MLRPAGVTISAVLLFLGAVLCIAIGGLMVVSFQKDPPPELRDAPIPAIYLVVFLGGFFASLAVWATLTAAGLLGMKPWSRVSALIFAGVLVFFQTGGLLLVLFALVTQPGFDARRDSLLVAGFALFYGVQILTGIWWLIYFNRAAVKAAFAFPAPPSGAPCPLSITVIAWHLVGFGAISLLLAWPSWPSPFLGFWLEGWSAKLVYLLWGAAGLYVGAGLLRLQPAALNHSLAYVYAATLNTLVCLPAVTARTHEILNRPGGSSHAGFTSTASEPLTWLLYAILLITCATPLWYLHTRKVEYLAAAAAGNSH